MSKVGCFVSIPKCASKSVLQILELGANRDDDWTEPVERHVIYENHQRLCVLEQRYDLSNLYVFAFVRNPHQRIKSWYAYHRHLAPYSRLSFTEWVKKGCPVHWTVQNATDWASIGESPLLQWNFLKGARSRIVVGQLEQFESDLRLMISELNAICLSKGLSRRFAYRGVQENTSDPAGCVYTQETWDLVCDLFREDFIRFGYPMRRAS